MEVGVERRTLAACWLFADTLFLPLGTIKSPILRGLKRLFARSGAYKKDWYFSRLAPDESRSIETFYFDELDSLSEQRVRVHLNATTRFPSVVNFRL